MVLLLEEVEEQSNRRQKGMAWCRRSTIFGTPKGISHAPMILFLCRKDGMQSQDE